MSGQYAQAAGLVELERQLATVDDPTGGESNKIYKAVQQAALDTVSLVQEPERFQAKNVYLCERLTDRRTKCQGLFADDTAHEIEFDDLGPIKLKNAQVILSMADTREKRCWDTFIATADALHSDGAKAYRRLRTKPGVPFVLPLRGCEPHVLVLITKAEGELLYKKFVWLLTVAEFAPANK